MRINVEVEFLWVPSDLGGHKGPPFSGMRLEIRWQRYLEAFLACAWDVECEVLTFDEVSLRGRARCVFSPSAEIPAEWLQPGQMIELLNGHKVMAVGKIVGP
jgi:hypothetical protein